MWCSMPTEIIINAILQYSVIHNFCIISILNKMEWPLILFPNIFSYFWFCSRRKVKSVLRLSDCVNLITWFPILQCIKKSQFVAIITSILYGSSELKLRGFDWFRNNLRIILIFQLQTAMLILLPVYYHTLW